MGMDLVLVLTGGLALALIILAWRHREVLRSLRRQTDALTALSERVAKAEQYRETTAPALIAEEKSRLAALVNDLHQGVLVCNQSHQLVLYNQIALKSLGLCGEIGLGRPLFGLMVMEPLLHCLDMLRRGEKGANMPFLSRTEDGNRLLQGRVSLLEPDGYVVTFEDVTTQITALAKRDALLREVIEILRDNRPNTALDHARRGYRSLLSGWWPMSDILSSSLFELVVARLAGSEIEVSLVGLPVWLHGDGHSLVLALDALLRAVGARQFDLSAEEAEGHCWIQLSWEGPKIAAHSMQNWLSVPVSPALGGLTVHDVMLHHTPKDPVEEERDGRQWLKLPLMPAHRAQQQEERGPGRPEFFDFNLLGQSRGGRMTECFLRDVTFVVFDTETTGLRPSEGDRIVSLAGVRIVGGRILTGENFNRIVNPGRPIPADSTKFHGLTDAQVAGKPPIELVLPQFHAFAEGAVLVAHNAAFDLKFLRMFEDKAGVSFDNPVLDTMLLSTFIDGSPDEQNLDAICRRYGVPNTERHSALGDSMATAALFLHMLDRLEQKGVLTLGDALNTLDMTLTLHQRAQAL
jgi:DNA polymerase-3 subunit epsilon